MNNVVKDIQNIDFAIHKMPRLSRGGNSKLIVPLSMNDIYKRLENMGFTKVGDGYKNYNNPPKPITGEINAVFYKGVLKTSNNNRSELIDGTELIVAADKNYSQKYFQGAPKVFPSVWVNYVYKGKDQIKPDARPISLQDVANLEYDEAKGTLSITKIDQRFIPVYEDPNNVPKSLNFKGGNDKKDKDKNKGGGGSRSRNALD